ncbi:tRNA-dihydrouridine synthase [Patescibacteria group bacterium]
MNKNFWKPPYYYFDKKVRGPFTIPAGIVTTRKEIIELIAWEIPEVGILTTKSTSLNPREGKKEPIIGYAGQYSLFNEVRLANLGAEKTAEFLSKLNIPKNKAIVGSVIGSTPEEVKSVAVILAPYVDVIEINVSCPNDEKAGLAVGQDAILVHKIVSAVVDAVKPKPVTVKIAASLDIYSVVVVSKEAGASGIVAINTDGPKEYNHNGHLVLKGGESGEKIFKLLLRTVKTLQGLLSVCPNIYPCGGIGSARQIRTLVEAKAQFVGTGIGTAIGGMRLQEKKLFFNILMDDLRKGKNNAKEFRHDFSEMKYRKRTVTGIKEISEDVFTITLNGTIKINPGQFIFAMIPEKGEKPFSALDVNSKSFSLLIQKRRYFTKELSELNNGDDIYIRGPHGRSPRLQGRILLVGGGTGVAGLYLFAKEYKNTFAILGAKEKIPYFGMFSTFCKKVLPIIENQEERRRLVTDCLDYFIESIKPDYVLNCGPKEMVMKAIEIERKYLSEDKILSATEEITKCGESVCGSCATPKGYCSCVDGPFMTADKI